MVNGVKVNLTMLTYVCPWSTMYYLLKLLNYLNKVLAL
jgi:hypothetical protein